MCSGSLFTGIFTRFYGTLPPNILVDEGKFVIEKCTWFMSSADYVDGYGAQPHLGAKAKGKGFDRMKQFFASDSNDLGATFKEIVINVDDWNAFVIADRNGFEKNAEVPTPILSLMVCDHQSKDFGVLPALCSAVCGLSSRCRRGCDGSRLQ